MNSTPPVLQSPNDKTAAQVSYFKQVFKRAAQLKKRRKKQNKYHMTR